MAPAWLSIQPVVSTATVATSYVGRPIVGPIVDTTNRPRVLIGWIHQDDNPDALIMGQLWCSVSADKGKGYEKLQIFDTSGNRSKNPGEVVFCGVANFTMVRMFHPYWAEAGSDGTFLLPRDMAWKPKYDDKFRLRQLYHKFLHEYLGNDEDGNPNYPIPGGPDDDEDDGAAAVIDTTDADDGTSLFIPQNEKGDAGPVRRRGRPAKAKVPKPPRVAKPRQTKAPRGGKPKKQNTTNSGYTSIFGNEYSASGPSTGPSNSEIRRQAALDDGESVKSESRATSIANQLLNTSLTSTTPRQNGPISLNSTPSPGRNIHNAINLESLDADELQNEIDNEPARLSNSQSPPTASQEQIDLAIDQYNYDLESERLAMLLEYQNPGAAADSSSSALPPTSPPGNAPSNAPTTPPDHTPESPALSNGGVQDSIETDDTPGEQNAQIQHRNGSSETLIEDDDLQYIGEAAVKQEVEGWGSDGMVERLTVADAIVLD